MTELSDAVAAAKLRLVSAGASDLPYLSEGLYALVTVPSDAVATVAADEQWRLYVNPTWASDHPIDDLAREIAHQLWHLLFDHAGRARAVGVDAANAVAWGEASDLAIVDAVGAVGAVPAWLIERARKLRLRRPDLDNQATAEQHWAKLSGAVAMPPDTEEGEPDAEARGSEGSASDGLHREWELPSEAGVGGLDAAAADLVRRSVAESLAHWADGRPGEIPGELARWVRATLNPRLPWEQLLAQATRRGLGWTSGRTHTTYTRPNRRAASVPNVALPGWRRATPSVACVIDTSGSVGDELLGRALAEVDGAIRALGVAASGLTILTCDAAVHAVRRVRRLPDDALVGGGGTDLRVALAAVEGLRPRPTLTVVFTDGLTPWPDAPPTGSAVVIALLLRPDADAPETPSWATTIECRTDLS